MKNKHIIKDFMMSNKLSFYSPFNERMIFRIIDDIMNNIIDGSNLSILNSRKEGFEQISILLGTILIMSITYLHVDFTCDMALTLQCIALIISCLTSLFITRKLMKYAKYNN